jgi:ADP-ribosylglycohydrolase
MGTVLEFSQTVINKESVQRAMGLPGGGPHGVAPGQITDDGELTLSLMNGLIMGKGKLNLKQIVVQYGLWIQSKPFDIGATIRNAFFKCEIQKPNPERVARAASKTSQSNGSLMKISPLGVFLHRCNDFN